MKHQLKFIAGCGLILAATLGCNLSNYFQSTPTTNSNQAVMADKTLIDQAADTVFGVDKTGIQQCDEVLAELEKPAINANESMLDNAKRVAIKQAIYRQVRSASANTTPKEKAEIGKYCAQVATQLKPAASPPNSPAKK